MSTMLPLSALVERVTPRPWAEGDNIPWNEAGFSERMLREHLTQQHDAASRRFEIIDRHVDFLHRQILGGQPGRVLDLGCGPGLYAARLARLGHAVRGIDFSPASVAYARQHAGEGCVFTLEDMRIANFLDSGGPGWDLAMLIYGEFNVFKPVDARGVLQRAAAALKPGGTLLLEVSNEGGIHRMGSQPPSWSARAEGLFSARPHLLLSEAFWDEDARAATHRYWVVDVESGLVERFAGSYQARSPQEYTEELARVGLENIQFYQSLEGGVFNEATATSELLEEEFFVVTGVKPVREGVGG